MMIMHRFSMKCYCKNQCYMYNIVAAVLLYSWLMDKQAVLYLHRPNLLLRLDALHTIRA